MAEECSTGILREAYDSVAAADPETAVLVPFTSIERSMARWRSARFPRNPPDAASALDVFNTHMGNTAHLFARHYKGGATTEHGSYLVLLNNTPVVQEVLKTTADVALDGTFRTSPRIFEQCVVFYITYSNVVFPVGAILLTGKSQILYSQAFQFFKTLLPARCRPQRMMMDWEQALRNASSQVCTYKDKLLKCLKNHNYFTGSIPSDRSAWLSFSLQPFQVQWFFLLRLQQSARDTTCGWLATCSHMTETYLSQKCTVKSNMKRKRKCQHKILVLTPPSLLLYGP